MRMTRCQAEFFREVADRFSRATGQNEYPAAAAVDWARGRGELELSPDDQREILVARMSEALRSDTTTDANGRRVRLRHCVTNPPTAGESECTLWSHVDVAQPEFLRESLRQRRRRIADDVEQLRADLDFINQRFAARGLRQIQMTIDDYRPTADEDDSAA
jgi:hypothetical protein